MTIAIALIEPQYPVNVGHIARLMKNFGLKRLYFVRPHFEKADAIKYSTHGSDLLVAAKTVTLSQLRKKFDLLIGTTAIRATSRLNVLRESVSAEQMAKIVHDASTTKDLCILFGRESSGLKNEELEMCDLVVTIDTKTKYRTMNVAHALAILLYEISKLKSELPVENTKKRVDLASQQDVDLLLRYISKLADAGNYDQHKKPLLEAAAKKLLAKSMPTTKDVMLLVSLLRKNLLTIERLGHK